MRIIVVMMTLILKIRKVIFWKEKHKQYKLMSKISIVPLFFRMMFAVALLLTVTTNSGEVTESVLFHPIDQIHTSISSWILTTAIDFMPYHIALDRVYQYTYHVKISINQAFRDFQHEDPKYNQLLSMTLNDLSSALNQIHITRTEVSDLIGHMKNNKNNRCKRSLLPLGGLFNFLFGMADQKDIDLLKQQVKEL